ncbi:ATP-dependent nuclease [Radiobacillus deserti]|uniref:AAA family ATPase n=1 Tax=Radiobacillus deserti TaxID=2594883 RepID=A0A516KDG1_9BACI|nr:AAA family ATPase [Radiobacillus deserti]QDP39454.1 AAA family ATPase [Radiobacillus deserti]
MYISRLNIKNFRCFDDIDIEFNEGMNVLIGSNNAGKTTVIRALELIFNRSKSKTLAIDDFNKNVDSSIPPEITVTATLQSSQNDTKDDKAIVASWLTKLDAPWEATLTYRFFLPEQEQRTYQEEYAKLTNQKEQWSLLESTLKRYVSRIYGGNISNRLRAEGEYLEKIHCETLDALRDVESKMFTGRNTLLKQLLLHFKDTSLGENQNESSNDGQSQEDTFTYHSEKLIGNLISKINQEEVLDFAEKTGASVGGTPALDGSLKESDVLSALRLIIKDQTGIEIPIINNGMGYNNLIFISLILSKFKMITSIDYGENAKTFPILLIEEPEAHLHPALQYNFLKFLSEEIKSQTFSKQIFITTHSTQITSAVGLDPIICLEKSGSGKVSAKYPSRVFSDSKEDQKSKKYVERFLDATKSAMLFSNSVLLVEGMAELVLLPLLAEKNGYDLDKHHVSLVRVDALTFKHFVKLYGAGIKPDRVDYSLQRRVGCIIDSDPRKIERKREEAEQQKRSWKKCWPFEINSESDNFEYDSKSGALKNLVTQQEDCANVNIYYQEENGKTFEYDLAWENYQSDLLFDESVEIIEIPELIQSGWENEKKERAKRASSFLIYADNQKGEVAFKIASKLEDEDTQLNLPTHIKNALIWVCHKNSEGV